MSSSSANLPFTLRRVQFPIMPCFAMTVHKAQGQTLDVVGIVVVVVVVGGGGVDVVVVF